MVLIPSISVLGPTLLTAEKLCKSRGFNSVYLGLWFQQMYYSLLRCYQDLATISVYTFDQQSKFDLTCC